MSSERRVSTQNSIWLRYLYPVLVVIASLIIVSYHYVSSEPVNVIDYFSLIAYGTITLIMGLSLFIVQRVIDIREVYFYLLGGFTFIYISLLLDTLDEVYIFLPGGAHILEDLLRLVGFGFIIIAIIKWIKHNDHLKLRLLELANTDALTGALNRRSFDIEANREFANAKRYDKPLSLIMLDIDNFKKINDEHGHFFGDLILKSFSREISDQIRTGDFLSRWGGDEFAILFPETDVDQALIIAKKIQSAVMGIDLVKDRKKISFTLSQGISTFQDNDYDVMQIEERADRALYKAKKNGRDQACIL